jgi:Anp1/Glycosyltransferase sugar-binding region containing DXD motif
MIPRVLHQTWKNHEIPERWQPYQRSWQENHPNWEYRLWTDVDNRALVAAHYPWFLQIYDRYAAEISRVDAARYLMMHQFGGVYADLDMESLAPLDELLEGEKLVLALEPANHIDQWVLDRGLDHIVGNAFLASTPRHPFWIEVLRSLVDAQLETSPLDATGPFMLTRTIERFTDRDTITVLPADRISPVPKRNAWAADQAGIDLGAQFADHAYTLHHWEGTWWRDRVTGRSIEQAVEPNTREPVRVSSDQLEAPPPRVLILTPMRDAASVLARYAANLRALTYPRDRITVAFLEGDSCDGTYDACAHLVAELDAELRGARLFKRDFFLHLVGKRWDPRIQRRRRAVIARARNHLLLHALDDEDWVLWLDADVSDYPADIIERLLEARRDVIVPHCVVAPGADTFDLNTFQYTAEARHVDWSRYVIDGVLTPPRGLARRYLDQMRGEELVRVDSVGGTMLLVRADLHRDGLIFPPYPYGLHIETEGLAIMARDMGHDCWALPGLEIVHR